jgi:hypothetical protein
LVGIRAANGGQRAHDRLALSPAIVLAFECLSVLAAASRMSRPLMMLPRSTTLRTLWRVMDIATVSGHSFCGFCH